MICARCGKETSMHTMSMFNSDDICLECLEKEKAHPQYREACEAVRSAEREGDYNFKGIGKPSDL